MKVFNKMMIIFLMFSGASMQAMSSSGSGSAGSAEKATQKSALSLADRALLVAASIGSETAAGIALESGARIDAQDADGQTALHKAIIKSYSYPDAHYALELCVHPKLVQFLMRAGADCTMKTRGGVSVLDPLSRNEDNVYRIAPLILRGMHHCNKPANDPQKALGRITYNAAYGSLFGKQRGEEKEKIDRYYALLADSLRAGSDMTCQICPTKGTINGIARDFEDQRMQGLIAAFQKEHSERVAQGLKSFLAPALYSAIFECLYAQPQKGVMTGYLKELLATPLRTPEITDDVFKKFKRFRMVDGDIWNVRDNQGNTALALAVIQGNMPIAKWMDDVPSRDEKLHLYQRARQHGHDKIVTHYWNAINADFQWALAQGDDQYVLKLVNLNIPIGTMANINNALEELYFARNYDKKLEIVKILFAAGADVNAVNVDLAKQTHLEYAAALGLKKDAIKLLLYLGADYMRPNSRTNLIPWEQTQNPEIKELLKDPKVTLENLTETEKKEFADIKAEREKRFAANKAQGNSAAAK